MKYSDVFAKRIACNTADDVFDYFMKSLKETIKGWDFFVDWKKVNTRVEEVRKPLEALNTLIGINKNVLREEFLKLLTYKPEVVRVLPLLLAIRDKTIKVLDSEKSDFFNFKEFVFECKVEPDLVYAEGIADFAAKSGIFDLLSELNISSLADYAMGVEVGLDSNARKNRTGTAMEGILETIVNELCAKRNYKYIPQATAAKIKAQLGYEVVVDKSERSFDFAVDTGNRLFLIETNYYGGGGSKLKAVAGEFSMLFEFIRKVTPQHEFVWITDGEGWHTTKKPLKEAFDKLDYILNLDMIEKGILDDILAGDSI